MKNEIRYADLFGGVGGFRLGIERATNLRCLQQTDSKGERSSENIEKQRGLHDIRKSRCVFYCDIDKYAVQTYNKNFGENHSPTDITKINTNDIPEIDMVCGGFPCQAFSIAGKRRGFEDTRGTLFFEVARIIKAKRPKIVFLENVKGLLNHDKGKTFRTIIQTLSELGYDVQWMVLNSKFFGVPQNRERVFIIGSLRGTGRPEILPFGESCREDNELQGQQTNTLKARYTAIGDGSYIIKSKQHEKKIIVVQQGCQAQRVFNPEGIAPTLRGLGGGQGAKTGLYFTQVHNMQPRSPNRPSLKYSSGGSGHLQREDTSYCLDGANTNAVEFNNMSIRRLTPIECERLQSFPDDWTSGVSDTQRYKQMGNAVTVNVIQAIATKLHNITGI